MESLKIPEYNSFDFLESLDNKGYGGVATQEFKTAGILKGQLSRFSGIIFMGFAKTKQRLIREIFYRIQASKDIKLSNIARTLKEDQALIKTDDRLSRKLDDVDFTEGINAEVVRLASSKVRDDMVIAIGTGDIRKRYGKKRKLLRIISRFGKKRALIW